MLSPSTYIFDIDGTIANIEIRQAHLLKTPKDWKQFNDPHLMANDEPIPETMEILRALKNRGYDIIFYTGRETNRRDVTLKWLKKHIGQWVSHSHLYMRQEKDYREDTIIKPELIESIKNAGHEIMGIFEDRARLVKTLRDMGYRVYHVDYGNF